MKLLFHVDVSVAKNGGAIELYLLSWLSVVGQVVGLRIPLEMLNQP
jgi:ubiquitin-like-conjugating enzyme ATG10